MNMEKSTIESKIKEQATTLRDDALEKLLNDINNELLLRKDVLENEELFAILSELSDLTQKKIDIRESIASIPETEASVISEIQSKIISLSKEIEENYPEIHQYIQLKSFSYRNPN